MMLWVCARVSKGRLQESQAQERENQATVKDERKEDEARLKSEMRVDLVEGCGALASDGLGEAVHHAGIHGRLARQRLRHVLVGVSVSEDDAMVMVYLMPYQC